jgi:hypothetical protein
MAKELKEIQELIELGFEYVCDLDGTKFFRKENKATLESVAN